MKQIIWSENEPSQSCWNRGEISSEKNSRQRFGKSEVNYKKEEKSTNNEETGGKVGEYECQICREICGNEQKQMVCIMNCGHRFCKDCVDRVLGTESSF